jgi:8-oxo-dGTP diphosphatase
VDVSEIVRAAGGVVCRRPADREQEVVVVHRVAYQDWTFPKGKTHEGEDEAEAALREVEEETSLRCRIERELGVTSYRDPQGRPKTVRYFEMTPVAGELEAAHEIDDARWVATSEARSLLTYARDLELLERLEEDR